MEPDLELASLVQLYLFSDQNSITTALAIQYVIPRDLRISFGWIVRNLLSVESCVIIPIPSSLSIRFLNFLNIALWQGGPLHRPETLYHCEAAVAKKVQLNAHAKTIDRKAL